MSKSKVSISADAKGAKVECDSCTHDVDVAQSCASAIASCANACCGSEGCGNALALIERTFVALGGHINSTDCLSKGFGLFESGKKASKGSINLKGIACLDADTCNTCVQTAMACNEKNGCLSKEGLKISPECFAGLYQHVVETGCIRTGFGHCSGGKPGIKDSGSSCGC